MMKRHSTKEPIPSDRIGDCLRAAGAVTAGLLQFRDEADKLGADVIRFKVSDASLECRELKATISISAGAVEIVVRRKPVRATAKAPRSKTGHGP